MTTKFLDNKIFTFNILLSWRFPRKIAFWTIFLPAPLPTPPEKRKFYFYCRLAFSETIALTTAAKLQQVWANSREMTSQKLNEEHEILRRFMAVVVSSAFKNSLIYVIFLYRFFVLHI